MRFKEKKCVISGGTSGIGLETAMLLIKEGAEVIVLGRDTKRGENCEKESNGKIRFIKCDVSEHLEVEKAFDKIVKEYGSIDYAFNNAGITSEYASIADSSPDKWHDVMKINVNGIYNCLRQELKIMSASNGGSIVNMSSCVSIIPIGFQSAYIASKYAVNGLTKSAAIEYAEKNIRINAIAPGPTLGGMNSEEKLKANPEKTQKKINVTAMKRFADPKEIASTVLWLLSDEASYITGTILPIDGGYNAGKF